MKSKDAIQQKQNSDDMLDCQYTARFYFNRAEALGYLSFIISVCSALCVFLPDEEQAIIIAIPIVFDIVAIVIQSYSVHCQKTAARLRNYFDSVVLGLNESEYSLEDIRTIKEIVCKTISQHSEEHRKQVRNNGSDNPPGLRDWYNLSFEETSTNAVFECQKQNYYWTDKLAKKRILISFYVIAGIIIICITSVFGFHLSAFKWVPCYFAIVYNQLSNIGNGYKHSKLMNEIRVITRLPKVENNTDQILHLQKKINELREIPVLEINGIHKHYNKKWSEIYAKMLKR